MESINLEFAQDISGWTNRCNESTILDIEPTSQPEMLSFKGRILIVIFTFRIKEGHKKQRAVLEQLKLEGIM